MKARLLAIATVLMFVSASKGVSLALMPHESGAPKCPMASMKHRGPSKGNCKHERPAMPCCPTPRPNPGPAPSAVECTARGACCQVGDERTRPMRQEGRLERATALGEGHSSSTNTGKNSSPRSEHAWVEAGIRYERPVFELKTDLRI